MTLGAVEGQPVAAGTLARFFARAHAEKASGELTVEHGEGVSRAFFRGGFPAGINVFSRFKPLGIFLMEIGWIDIEALDASLAEVARSKKPQGQVLVELGAITEDKLALGLRRQQLANAEALLEIADGSYHWNPSATLPAWTEDIAISPHEAVVRAFVSASLDVQVASIVDGVGETDVRLDAGWTDARKAFDLNAEDRAAVEALGARGSLGAMAAVDGVDARRAEALLAALACFGLVSGPGRTPRADSTGTTDGSPEPEEDSPTQAVAAAEPAGEAGEEAASGGSEPATADTAPTSPKTTDRKRDTSRRSRLLRRAFQNIPGAQPLSHAPQGDEPAKAKPTTGEVKKQEAKAERALSSIAKAFMQEVKDLAEKFPGMDHYQRLRIPRQASQAEVKTAHVAMVKKFHPDRAGALDLPPSEVEVLEDVFEAIQTSYEVLSDPEERKRYDSLLDDAKLKGDADKAREQAAAEINFKKGVVLFKKKAWDHALKYLEPAWRADPENGQYVTYYAWALFSVGPQEEVRTEVTKMLRFASRADSGADRAHYYLGLLARMSDDLERAEKHFSAAVKKNPDLTEAVTELRLVKRRLERRVETTTGKLLRKVLGRDD